MTEEEIKALNEQISKVAGEAAKKGFEDASAEDKQKIANMQKELDSQKAEFTKIGDQLVKINNAFQGVSLQKDLGAGKKELDLDKAKFYRGIVTGNWHQAEKEFDIANQTRNKALEMGVGTNGGFVIPVELSSNIVDLVRSRNVLRELGVYELNAMRGRYEIPRVTGGVTAYMVGEGKQITESGMTFGVINMEPKKCASLVYVSREMIDAADPAIVAMLENDMANALAEQIMTEALYGNGGVSCVGLFNQLSDTQKLATGADGDDPTKAFMRKLRAKIPQKYAGATTKALTNRNVIDQIASVASTAAPDAAAIQTDDVLARNAIGAGYSTTGLVRATKAKGSGTNLSEIFLGDWSQVIQAIWWGGLRIESTNVGGSAFANDMTAFKAVLPFDVALRRPDAMACATFVKSILS